MTRRYIQDADESAQGLSARLQRFHEQFNGFKADMVDHVLRNAVPESVLEHPMFALNPRQPWVRGRVALLGDAAHVMPPNLSQGTPAAWEDAVQLAASLRDHGISDAALQEYEQAREEGGQTSGRVCPPSSCDAVPHCECVHISAGAQGTAASDLGPVDR